MRGYKIDPATLTGVGAIGRLELALLSQDNNLSRICLDAACREANIRFPPRELN